MSLINYASREINCKLVYYGPGLGGKTTNLETIHRRSEPTRRGKLIALNTAAERTLFFDLLPVELGSFQGYRVRTHLCTVPGQLAHGATRRQILRHVDAVVFVVDSQPERMAANQESLRDLRESLSAQGDDFECMPSVVQFNKRDLPNVMPVAELERLLQTPAHVPRVEACAADGKGVFETLRLAITACLDAMPDLRKAPTGHSPSILPGVRPSMFPEAAPAGLYGGKAKSGGAEGSEAPPATQ